MKESYKQKVKKLLEDAEKAFHAQAWTSAANSYDSAIEGMLRHARASEFRGKARPC